MLSVNDDDIAKPYRSIYVPISPIITAKIHIKYTCMLFYKMNCKCCVGF